MANLSFQRIREKLSEAFAKEGRVIVFWYDEKKEWTEQIRLLELQDVEILTLEERNQFEVKYKIEYENPDTNYLVYSALPKPDDSTNHLLDVFLYSREFKADGVSMFADELLIGKDYRHLLEKYAFFFRNSSHQESFRKLGIASYDDYYIPLGVMCCLCEVVDCDIQKLVVHILVNGAIIDNKYLQIFTENGLAEVFWDYCRKFLGWKETCPTFEKLLITIYMTYFKRELYTDLPNYLDALVAAHTGNVTQVLESLRNNRQKYHEYADYTAGQLNIKSLLRSFSIDAIVNCTVYKEADMYVTDWIMRRLLNHDTGAMANKKSLATICGERARRNGDAVFEHDYLMLENATLLLSARIDDFSGTLETFIADYIKYYYKIDLYYRHFIENYDKLIDGARYEELQNYVENYYTNSFLAAYISAWNKAYAQGVIKADVIRMRKFYSFFLRPFNKKTVVVISDALRYETAAELAEKFKLYSNSKVNMKWILGELPSITQVGMAALLPNKALDIDLDGKVTCDGKQTDDLQKRQAILQSANENSRCIQFSDLSLMKRDDMRSLLKNTDTLYVYHNQIDSRGESQSTERDVFAACRDTINELYDKIKTWGRNANVYHFIIVSDHGFIYKRDKLSESDKIGDVSKLSSLLSRRFIISGKPDHTDGICAIKIGDLYGNDNSNYVLFPESVNVFKCPGGLNYAHGGSSPQELIIPVIDIDIERYAVETRPAEIRLSRVIAPKINSLITSLEFMQTEAVSSEVRPEVYEVFFTDDKSLIISDMHTVTADMTAAETINRLFKLTFNLKNQEYSDKKKYLMIIRRKDNNAIELSRTEVTIDIAFAGNFGF